MALIKSGDEIRYIVERLQYRKREIDKNALDAPAQEAQLDEALRRAQLQFPASDICPRCWIERNVESPMTSVIHQKPMEFDLFRCDACGYQPKT